MYVPRREGITERYRALRVGDRPGWEGAGAGKPTRSLAGGPKGVEVRVSCPCEATGAAQIWPDQGTEKMSWGR